jgi:hypothetical protein
METLPEIIRRRAMRANLLGSPPPRAWVASAQGIVAASRPRRSLLRPDRCSFASPKAEHTPAR